MANLFTICRIILSLSLLYIPTFSFPFYFIYILTGITDILDGLVARKTNTESDFGAKLDTGADMVFTAVALYKILPKISISGFIIIWIGIIAGIKFGTILSGLYKEHKLVSIHSKLNKITGFLIFMMPLTFGFINISVSASAVCALATVASINEYITVKKQYTDEKLR